VFSRSTNGDQRHAEIANFAKHAVQRCLVHNRATEQRGPVAFPREAQPIEPVGPTGVEVPFESDFVAPSFVGLHVSKVGSDVVSAPHHMW